MYSCGEIRHVHLEPTTRCNASCPMCARNTCGVTAPGLKLTELLIGDVQAILPQQFLAQVTGFDMCGAYGEPTMARDLIAIAAYVRSTSPRCTITIYTNGGARSPRWWKRLAQSLGTPARVIFAIDGLAETNKLYRRGIDFARVMLNARAFIDAGGAARWEFLAFRHNEHEIEAASRMSEDIGFREFSVKKTGRFLEPTYDFVPEFQQHHDLNRFPIYSAQGTIVGYLEPPSDPALVNDTVRRYEELLSRHGSLEALFSSTPIRCRVMETQSVFIGAQGYVFPCCWLYVQATRPGLCSFPTNADYQVYDLIERSGGFSRIDALHISLRAAVESPLFAAIESSWSRPSIASGRLRVCARACGIEFPAYFDQFADTNLLPQSLYSTQQ